MRTIVIAAAVAGLLGAGAALALTGGQDATRVELVSPAGETEPLVVVEAVPAPVETQSTITTVVAPEPEPAAVEESETVTPKPESTPEPPAPLAGSREAGNPDGPPMGVNQPAPVVEDTAPPAPAPDREIALKPQPQPAS